MTAFFAVLDPRTGHLSFASAGPRPPSIWGPLRGRSAKELAEGARDAALAIADRLRDDLQIVALRLS